MTFLLRHRPAGILRVSGLDAPAFLQGQFTNELAQDIGSVRYGLFLNQKGRVVADAWALRLTENEFFLVSYFSAGVVIKQRLEDYIVADDVIVVDESAPLGGLAIWGADCEARLEEALGLLPPSGKFVRSGNSLVFAGRRATARNYEILGPETDIRELHEKLRALGSETVDMNQAEYVRIADGIPAIPQDIGPGDLPNEGDLDETAISYTKGCYLGQEVMARLKNMGQIRRRLHVLRGAGKPPENRAMLYQGDKKVGEIRSAASQGGEFAALAMLSLLHLDQAWDLSLGPNEALTLKISPRG